MLLESKSHMYTRLLSIKFQILLCLSEQPAGHILHCIQLQHQSWIFMQPAGFWPRSCFKLPRVVFGLFSLNPTTLHLCFFFCFFFRTGVLRLQRLHKHFRSRHHKALRLKGGGRRGKWRFVLKVWSAMELLEFFLLFWILVLTWKCSECTVTFCGDTPITQLLHFESSGFSLLKHFSSEFSSVLTNCHCCWL